MSRSDHRVGSWSFRGFKPIVRVGFYRLPGRRAVRCWRGLEGREDPRGKASSLSWLEDEGSPAKRLERVLRILKGVHTGRETETSEFHRRTSLELVLRNYTGYIHRGAWLPRGTRVRDKGHAVNARGNESEIGERGQRVGEGEARHVLNMRQKEGGRDITPLLTS